MTRTITAEYLADEQKLKLSEPLDGVDDHQTVTVSVNLPSRTRPRPWLELEGTLPAEVAEGWRESLREISQLDSDD